MFLFKRNTGYYYINYQDINGKLKSISTKCTKKQEAMEVLVRFKDKYEQQQANKCEEINLFKLIFEFLRNKARTHTDKSIKSYQTTFRFFKEQLTDIPVRTISNKEIRKFLEYRLSSSSLYAARKDLIVLKSFFRFAQESNFVNSNPTIGIKQYRLPEKLPVYFGKAEFQKLLSVIDDPEMKNLVLVALNTGMRLGELLQLTWEQVNIDKKIITLSNNQYLTKSKKVRVIPINEKLVPVISKMSSENCYGKVFSFLNRGIKDNKVTVIFKNYVRKAKVNPKLHFHSLRHSFASWLIQSDVNIYYVSKLLGHSNIKTTEIYAHLNQSNLHSAVNNL